MAKIKMRLDKERQDFMAAIEGKFIKKDGTKLTLTNAQAVFIREAIKGLEYIEDFINDNLQIPSPEFDEKTIEGLSYSALFENIITIAMAEYLLYEMWKEMARVFDFDGDTFNPSKVDLEGYGSDAFSEFQSLFTDEDFSLGELSDCSDTDDDTCDCRDI